MPYFVHTTFQVDPLSFVIGAAVASVCILIVASIMTCAQRPRDEVI